MFEISQAERNLINRWEDRYEKVFGKSKITPQEQFDKAVKLNDDEGKIFMLFGKTGEEILELIRKDEMKKMTREEAKEKLLKIGHIGLTADTFLSTAEVLGLIEFEPEPPKAAIQPNFPDWLAGESVEITFANTFYIHPDGSIIGKLKSIKRV